MKCTILPFAALLIQFGCNEAFHTCRRHNNGLRELSLHASIEEQFSNSVNSHDEIDETYETNLQMGDLASQCSPRNVEPAAQAVGLLRSLEFPDTISYNSVLKALAKTSSWHNKDAARRAVKLLKEMESLYEIQKSANQEWYIRLDDDALEEEEISEGAPKISVKPNYRSYSTVMDACARQTNPGAAQQAQDLLQSLRKKYDGTGDLAFLPTTISYNTVINGWAKAGAGERGAIICENILNEMNGLADVISFNAVLHAWAKSEVPNAGERAEKILRSMKDVKPNARTYNTAIHAWSRSTGTHDSAKRAHSLLQEMERLSKDDPNMMPECISYSSVVNAYALSKSEPLKAHMSFLLLQRMIKLGKENKSVRPNIVTYNTALNACAASCPIQVNSALEKSRHKRLPSLPQIVRTLYDQVVYDINLKPDHVTYSTVLKAVANLFLGESDQIAFGRSVFKSACKNGQVSKGVVAQLRQALPAEDFRDLLPDDYDSSRGISLNKLPKEWVCDVRGSGRKRNKKGDYTKGAH